MPEDNGITITPQGDAVGVSIGDNNYQEGVFAKTTGDVANVVNEIEDSLGPASPRMKAFAQIQRNIENNNNLSPEEKNYALQQLKYLESTSQGNRNQVMVEESNQFLTDASII